ncbi:TPA: hypothetical protein N0F65_007222 [Lagenidium giganteum]|uniref:Conserved oligomeric Golgi complex subunit 1 n=1 Tax=Lagenidium giganteum TaxID=4803 RepID=A0AAV2ZB27_9STRA|nr:TPA: hypothetical protein N0F65_007222 [Lagenidium giganteum]
MVMTGVGVAAMAASNASDAGADFLRKLSVADAKVMLEKMRMEKQRKTQEMQKMIGVRYRDLIESADEIVTMHSAALRLEASLKEMPERWQRMDKTVTVTLAPTAVTAAKSAVEGNGTLQQRDANELHERIGLLLDAPERMWQLLDRGQSLTALGVFLEAKRVNKCTDVQAAKEVYPFLETQWSGIQGFRARMICDAKRFLLCRGKPTAFYSANLCTLAILEEWRSSRALFEGFLDARTKWMSPSVPLDQMNKQEEPMKQLQHHLMVILRTMMQTIADTQGIFWAPVGEIHPLAEAFKHNGDLRQQMTAFSQSGEMLQVFCKWFSEQQLKIDREALDVIARIPSISHLSRVQTKLNNAAQKHSSNHSDLWSQMKQKVEAVSRIPESGPDVTIGRMLFLFLFGEAFRKRTRDLVQSSFVDALNAIKQQIRSAIIDQSSTNQEVQLQCIRFYEHFENIHKNTQNLDSSDLQNVLTEEFLRTLLKLVMLFESEYPAHPSGTSHAPTYFLQAANICAAIIAAFPLKMHQMFPGARGDETTIVSKAISDRVASSRQVFLNHADGGTIDTKSLRIALEEVDGDASRLNSFIDDELQHVGSLGFHAFFLISEVKRRSSYPQLFVLVLRNLAQEYCESWARGLLDEKIEPLRALLKMEQYDLTNEEWVSSHEGWSEEVIKSEVDDDENPSSPRSDGVGELGEEKVWLPWCETPMVSTFLFSCCYALDEAKQLIRSATGATENHVSILHQMARDVLLEQLTIASVAVYDGAVDELLEAKKSTHHSVLNFGECCILQFLFDMYFVRATLGFSDFIRFGWGDELDPEDCSQGLLKLTKLFERMQDFVDPVDWEIYGPQLIENVVIQFRKSRLLFSSLSESNDINEINGKPIHINAQDTRPIVKIAEPVARFSLLPVPSNRRRLHRTSSAKSNASADSDAPASRGRPSMPSTGGSLASLKLQDILTTSAGSNLLSAATSGNILSSAAKGMSYLSSATSSYLREGESRTSKYF